MRISDWSSDVCSSDLDVLIWAASQLLAADDRGLPISRFFRFTPYQLLTSIGRGTGARNYHLLKGALTRLQSTVVRTTIRHGEHWRRQQFSWINEWEELVTRTDRKSVVYGKSVSVRVDLGGRRIIKKKTKKTNTKPTQITINT